MLDIRTFAEVEDRLLPGIATLLHSDLAVYHHCDLAPLLEIDIFWPSDVFRPSLEAYSSVMHTHPFVRTFARELPKIPVTILDVVSAREWRASALFAESHGPMGAHHQMTVNIAGRLPRVRAVSVARASPAYSLRERDMLNVLAPHVRATMRRAYLLSTGYLAQAVVPVVDRVVLGRHDPVLHLPDAMAARLTARQVEVLHLVADGLSNHQAARRLGVAPSTVAKHLENAFDRLEVDNRTSAVQLLRPM